MEYGHFDDERREYVITNPKTPVKWINYIGTLAFGGFVDHTGGALICSQDPALNRITRYLALLPNSDFKGETLYVRFREGEGYRVFSPFFVPTLDPYDRYECHVGLGYMRVVSELYGLRAEVTMFVPIGGRCELRDIRLTNLGPKPREVDVIPVVEYTHFDALKQLTNADWVPQTMQSRAVVRDGHLVLTQYAFMRRDTLINTFTSSAPVSSFESDRVKLLGDYEYGTWARPLALQRDELSNSEAERGDNIGALLHHLGNIQPGETRRLVTQLGQAESVEAAEPQLRRYWQPAASDAALSELGAFWDDYLARLQVETPDADLNRMLNIHNPRQCYTTKNWSRYLSLYQPGYGSRGIGFRDSSQDVLAVTAAMPTEVKPFIRQLLSVQKRDGSAMHQFNPLSLEASVGDSAERDDRPHYYSDDHLWGILAVTNYLRETGDLGFLDDGVPYYEKDRQGQPLESDSVLGHLQRGLAFTEGDVGAHGLPRLGFADWNDTVNLAYGAESLFTANLYGRALQELIELARFRGDAEWARRLSADYEEMKRRFNACAWDGAWFIRYFDADGTPLGSHLNPQGQIYLNGQSWPVLSGFADPERGRRALEAVFQKLNTRHGLKLSAPGYSGFDSAKGGVTTFPPGAKENGGIFLHPNPWAIIAETMLGHGDRAYAYYRQINPAAKNERIDEYQVEPYVYAQNILGDEHPQFGLGRNSWLSGTAAWMYVAGTQYVLGLQPAYAGLRIDPCVPHAWSGLKATRFFRGAWYDVTVRNPAHVCRGVAQLALDGAEVAGNLVPVQAGGRHTVVATLG